MKSRFKSVATSYVLALGACALLWGCSGNNGNNNGARPRPTGYIGQPGTAQNGQQYASCNPNILDPNNPASPCYVQGPCVKPELLNQCPAAGTQQQNGIQPLTPQQQQQANGNQQRNVAPNYLVPNVNPDIILGDGQPNIIRNRTFYMQSGFVHDEGNDTCHIQTIDDLEDPKHAPHGFNVTRKLNAPCAPGVPMCTPGQWVDRLDFFFDANGNLTVDTWSNNAKIATNSGSTPYTLEQQGNTVLIRVPRIEMYGGSGNNLNPAFASQERVKAAILDKINQYDLAEEMGATLPKDFYKFGSLGASQNNQQQQSGPGMRINSTASNNGNESNLGASGSTGPDYFREVIENFVGYLQYMPIAPQHITGILSGLGTDGRFHEEDAIKFTTDFHIETNTDNKCEGSSHGYFAGLFLK